MRTTTRHYIRSIIIIIIRKDFVIVTPILLQIRCRWRCEVFRQRCSSSTPLPKYTEHIACLNIFCGIGKLPAAIHAIPHSFAKALDFTKKCIEKYFTKKRHLLPGNTTQYILLGLVLELTKFGVRTAGV